jgi:hypothetical protein
MIINLERGFSAYTDSNNPDTNYYGNNSLYCYSGQKEAYLYTPVTDAKGGVIPLTENVLVAQGKLTLYVAADLPASTTITVKRITSLWNHNDITDNNKPTVTSTNQAQLVSSATEGDIIEIDCKDMIQDVVDNREASGYVWFGFQITVNKTSNCIFASWANDTLGIRPYVQLKYSVPPQQPRDLRPSGTIIGTLTPVVSAEFFEDDPEDFCSKLQVQINPTLDWSSPQYDSGSQATNKSSWPVPGSANLVVNTLYYWRIRLGDSYGVWSLWSDAHTFTVKTMPSCNITSLPDNTRLPANYDFASGVGDWTLSLSGTAAATKVSLDDDEGEGKTCGVKITDDGAVLGDIILEKADGAKSNGDILIYRVRVRTTMDNSPTLRFRLIRNDSPFTVYIDEDEIIDEANEWFVFEYQHTMTESQTVKVLCQMGGQYDDQYEETVEFDYMSVNEVIHDIFPTITHTFTPGGNGGQVYVRRELWWKNTVTNFWEEVDKLASTLNTWLTSSGLTYDVPLGVIPVEGDYKCVVKVQDGTLPREAVENQLTYAEDEVEFEIRGDEEDGVEIEETGDLGTVRYEEHYTDIAFAGTWTDRVAEDSKASNGDYKDSKVLDSTATLVFQGSGVTLIGQKGPDRGKLEVFVDGVSEGVVDCYNGSVLWQQELKVVTGLTEDDGISLIDHTVVVKCLYEKNASSSDYLIDVDAFDITGHNIPFLSTFEEEIEMDELDESVYDYYRDGV